MRNRKSEIGYRGLSGERGVITLATVVVIFFTSLVIAASIQFIGVGELLIGFQEGQSEEAFEFADSCADEALLRLKRDASYAGGTLSEGDLSCTISVSGSAGERTVSIEATNGTAVRSISVDVVISGNVVTVDEWSEDTL